MIDWSAMKVISSLLPYIQIVLAIALIAVILLQQTGAAMGGAFGGSDNFSSAFHTRRGLERTLFIATIVIGILFAVSALVNLIY
jgi:preprotein translocase subunit SecG